MFHAPGGGTRTDTGGGEGDGVDEAGVGHERTPGVECFLSFGVKHVKVWAPALDGTGYSAKGLRFNTQTQDTAVSALFLPSDPPGTHGDGRRSKSKHRTSNSAVAAPPEAGKNTKATSPLAHRRAATGMVSGYVYVWDLVGGCKLKRVLKVSGTALIVFTIIFPAPRRSHGEHTEAHSQIPADIRHVSALKSEA